MTIISSVKTARTRRPAPTCVAPRLVAVCMLLLVVLLLLLVSLQLRVKLQHHRTVSLHSGHAFLASVSRHWCPTAHHIGRSGD